MMSIEDLNFDINAYTRIIKITYTNIKDDYRQLSSTLICIPINDGYVPT